PSGGWDRPASQKGSCAAAVFPALPGLVGGGPTGRQDKDLLPRRLAALEDDNHPGYAFGSDYERPCRDSQILRLVLECQLRVAHIEKDAPQGGRVETNPPRSENQTDERTRTVPQARR